MDETVHYSSVSKILRETVLEMHIFSESLLVLESQIRTESKQMPVFLKEEIRRWSSAVSACSDNLLEKLIGIYCTEYWKDRQEEQRKMREFNSEIRNKVLPEFIDPKVEKKIHFSFIERFMQQLFPTSELRKTLNDSETRFENYLKMMTGVGGSRKQKKIIEKVSKFDNQVELKKILKEKNNSINSERFKQFQDRLDIRIEYKKISFAVPNRKHCIQAVSHNQGLYEIVTTINDGRRLLVSDNISIAKEANHLIMEDTSKAFVFGATLKEAGNMISVVHLPSHKKLAYREDKKLYIGLQEKASDPKVKILWLKDLENTLEKFDSLECQKSRYDSVLKSFGNSVAYLKDVQTLNVIQSIVFGPIENQKLTKISKSMGQEIKDFLILQNGYIAITYTEKVKSSFKSTIEIFSIAGNSLFNYSVHGKVIRQIKDSPDGHHIIALVHSGEKSESSVFLHLYSLNTNGICQESSLPLEAFPSLKYGASMSFEQLEGEFYVITLVSKKGKQGSQEKPDIVTVGIEENQLQLVNSDYGDYFKWLQNVAVLKPDSSSKISIVGVDKKNLMVIDYNLLKAK